MKTDTRAIRSGLSKKLEPLSSEAWIFGSLIKGYAVPGESDVDLLVVPKPGVNRSFIPAAIREEWEALMEIGLVLHIFVFHPKDPKSLLDIARQGKRIV